MKLIELLKLNEYSQKIINQKVAEWTKETNETVPAEVFIAAINKFDSVKGNIPSKFSNPNELKKLPPKFRPLDLLTPEEKRKIEFQSKGKPHKPKAVNDILNYTWKDMEYFWDAYGLTGADKKDKSGFSPSNKASEVKISGDVKLTYENNGLYIYEGSTEESCIRLNYVFNFKNAKEQIKTYNFCIGLNNPAANRYSKYRFGGQQSSASKYRSFYYVVDSTQTPDVIPSNDNDDEGIFKNWYHIFVIHVFEDGLFGITDAVNTYDIKHEFTNHNEGATWDQIGAHMLKYGGESGKKAWDKIKGLKNVFKYIHPTTEEAEKNAATNGKLNVDGFLKIRRELQNFYIRKRAGEPGFFNREIFAVCDKEQKQMAINNGYKPSFSELMEKNGEVSQGLARTYAKYKFSRNKTEFQENPEGVKDLLPLPFVPYLKEDERDLYYELFKRKQITFEYTLKYFGEELAKEYVNEQVKNLAFVPEEAIKYISDSKLKALYNVVKKLYKNWEYDSNTNYSDEELSQQSEMGASQIDPTLLFYSDWKNLEQNEREIIIQLTKKYGNVELTGDSDVNIFIKFAVPYVVNMKGKDYVLLPLKKEDDNIYEKWILSDVSGNAVKGVDGNETIIDDSEITGGFPIRNESKKYLDSNEIKFKFTSLNESKYNLLNYKSLLLN